MPNHLFHRQTISIEAAGLHPYTAAVHKKNPLAFQLLATGRFRRLTALLRSVALITILLIGSTALLCTYPETGGAAQVSLVWDHNTPIPEAYRLYKRTATGTYDYSRPNWSGNSNSCTIANLADATRYYFVVRAYSGGMESGNSNEATFSTPINLEPSANAGPDQILPAGTLVTLNGAGSSDPDGDTLRFIWTQISGTSVQLSNPYVANPTFRAPSTAATLIFRLTVIDPSGLNASDTCQVQIYTAGTPTPGTPVPPPPLQDEVNSDQPPSQPRAVSPENGAVAVTMRPELATSAFTSPNPSARHAEIEWQILSQRDRIIVLNVMRAVSNSNRLRVPKLILEPETTYLWKVRYFDQYGNASQWSTESAFTTRNARYFLSDNGVSANQDVPADTDLNGNDIADIQEDDMLKSILTPDGRMIAVGIEASRNVVSLDTAIVTEPVAEGVTRNADLLPYGLLSYRIRLREPGQQAAVTLYFSEPVRTPAFWMAFGDQGRWSDCSSSVYPQSDGFSVERLITDGGPDDADGVANGVIVDILAPQAGSTQLGELDRGLGNTDNADPAARSGCFIRSILLFEIP